MSWESLNSKQFLRNGVAHQLSASRLLPSPDCTKPEHIYLDGGLDSPLSHHGSELMRYEPYLGTSNSLLGGCALSTVHERTSTLTNWGCFTSCSDKLQQVIAKRKINQGLKLYNKHKQNAAVRKWKSALKTIKERDDKFALLGYLFQGYMDWGKYRESVEFAHAQLQISEELDSPHMRAEAYLNLARANQKLGCFETALNYARHSLYNECDVCLTAGYVHLTVGCVHLELAMFTKSLDSLQRAHKIAQGIHDPALELQVYVGLSELFHRLQDVDRSTQYASKAYDLSRSLQLGDLNSRHHRAALLQMASTLRKQGEFGDAHDYCSEATRLALVSGDHATYVRSLRIMGDIFRKKSDLNKAFINYETAMGAAASMGDRVAQMESMDGAARCLESLRVQQKICNCRPLEFNKRLLQVCKSVGAKLLTRTVRLRLSNIYEALGDEDERDEHERYAIIIEQELGLRCGACSSPMGLDPDCLEPLPCGHIIHSRCVQLKRKRKRCPDCHRIDTISLASLSLRASTSTLNSNYITSSV